MSRTVNVVAGVIAVHHGAGVGYRRDVGEPIQCVPCVSIERVGRIRPLVAMSPDDADKLADELRAAAKAARGET